MTPPGYKQSEEVKKRISESCKKTYANGRKPSRLGVEVSKHTRQLQREARLGSKSWCYQAFILIADIPKKGKEEYVFDGDRPSEDCYKAFGISCNRVSDLKKGGTIEIGRIDTRTRHPWPKGTTLKIKLIK